MPPEDLAKIREAIRRRYASVADRPEGQFAYPVGRSSLEALGYRSDFLERLPAAVVDRFVGVGNPFSMGEAHPGENVLDIGCGCGLDAQVAAFVVGPEGNVRGVDLSEEMLEVAREGKEQTGLTNLEYRLGAAEALPVESGWADLVVTNGVLNLSTCKASAFAEIFRVLKPGGRFQAADLVLDSDLPPDLLENPAAWST